MKHHYVPTPPEAQIEALKASLEVVLRLNADLVEEVVELQYRLRQISIEQAREEVEYMRLLSQDIT